MNSATLQRFEQVAAERKCLFTKRLQPGLPEVQIGRELTQAGVIGDTGALVEIYSWRNGMFADADSTLDETSFLQGTTYQFMDLASAIEHWKTFSLSAQFHPQLSGVVGEYFPIFWDGASGYLAADLTTENHGRVVLLEFESTEAIREAYASLEDLFADATRALFEK